MLLVKGSLQGLTVTRVLWKKEKRKERERGADHEDKKKRKEKIIRGG